MGPNAGSGTLVKWRCSCRGIRREPRTFEGCDDRARWADLLLEKAEQAK